MKKICSILICSMAVASYADAQLFYMMDRASEQSTSLDHDADSLSASLSGAWFSMGENTTPNPDWITFESSIRGANTVDRPVTGWGGFSSAHGDLDTYSVQTLEGPANYFALSYDSSLISEGLSYYNSEEDFSMSVTFGDQFGSTWNMNPNLALYESDLYFSEDTFNALNAGSFADDISLSFSSSSILAGTDSLGRDLLLRDGSGSTVWASYGNTGSYSSAVLPSDLFSGREGETFSLVLRDLSSEDSISYNDSVSMSFTVAPAVVPEPGTYALLMSVIVGLGVVVIRRRANVA